VSMKQAFRKLLLTKLRHSREMTRVCSRRVTHRPGGAGDDNALAISGLSARTRFRGWATLSEHKWSSFGERRGTKAVALGLFAGAPLNPNQIEELLHQVSQPKVAQTVRQHNEDEDD